MLRISKYLHAPHSMVYHVSHTLFCSLHRNVPGTFSNATYQNQMCDPRMITIYLYY